MSATRPLAPPARPAGGRVGWFGLGGTLEAAVGAAAAAALAHALAAPAHFRSWPAAGLLFAGLAVAQAALGGALVVGRRGPVVLLAGIWGNVVAVLVYIVSRTVVIPFAPARGPHGTAVGPGRPVIPARAEAVGSFDLFTVVVELALVGLLLTLLPTRLRRPTATGLGIIGSVLWVGLAAVLAT